MQFKVKINIHAKVYRKWIAEHGIQYGRVSGIVDTGTDPLAGVIRNQGKWCTDVQRYLMIEIPSDDDAVMFKLAWSEEILSLK